MPSDIAEGISVWVGGAADIIGVADVLRGQ